MRTSRARSSDFPSRAAGVTLLELLVEDAGDGASSDWGVWIEPQLER